MAYHGGCDQSQRGQAAEDREHYSLSDTQRRAANAVVHCHNNNSSCPAASAYAKTNPGSNNPTKSTWKGK